MAPWGPLCLGTRARTCVCADARSPDGLKVVDKDVSRSSEGEEEGEEPPVRALIPHICPRGRELSLILTNSLKL